MNRRVLRQICSEGGHGAVGYYVMLRALGCPPISVMCEELGVTEKECLSYEGLLERMGFIRTGVSYMGGRSVEITSDDMIEDEAKKLAIHFGRRVSLSLNEINTQTNIARGIVGEVGYDAAKWMIDYLLDVKRIKIFSLRYLEKCLPSMYDKYTKFKSSEERLNSMNASEEQGWSEVEVREPPAPPSKKELSSLLRYGIVLDKGD